LLIATLPRELKIKVKPLQDQVIDSVTRHGRIPLQPKYYGGLPGILKEEESFPDKEFLNDCYNWVLKLVNEVSSARVKRQLNTTRLSQADDK
jgi:hypothetical protein